MGDRREKDIRGGGLNGKGRAGKWGGRASKKPEVHGAIEKKRAAVGKGGFSGWVS